LAGTPLGEVEGYLQPRCCRVLVVEDKDGHIVGQCVIITVAHGEGLWIDAAHQKRGAVGRQLRRVTREVMNEIGATQLYTSGETPMVGALLKRHGGVPLNGPAFMWGLGE